MRMSKRQSHQVAEPREALHSKRFNVVQETRLIEQERQEKEALQRAFSEEKHRNLNLVDRTRTQETRLEQLEREVGDLRAHNMRLRDSEGAATRELESMRERNSALLSEAEQMRRQIRAQEDAIVGAHHLKEQTDRMMIDYEKIKEELSFTQNKNQDLQQTLNVNMVGRRKAEDDLLKTIKDLDDFKQRSRDAEAGDGRQISHLQSKVQDLQKQVDTLASENRSNMEQLGLANKDVAYWRDLAERAQDENRDFRTRIEDLEVKNRLLNDKLTG